MTTTDRTEAEVRQLHNSRDRLLKARVIGGDRPAGQADPSAAEEADRFNTAGALEPPYGPETLVSLLEHSNSLRQNIDSYVTNVHAHGHRFEPIVDLKSDDANTQIQQLLMAKKQREKPSPKLPDPAAQVPLPTDEEVAAARAEMEELMRAELMRLRQFFNNVSLDFSFEQLRMRTGQDQEVTGNSYWELLEDAKGELAQFNHIPSFSMRLMPVDKGLTTSEAKVRVDPVTWGEIEIEKRFRRFVQVFEDRAIYFKEMGDPRIVSAKDGTAYKDDAAWAAHIAQVPADRKATEVLHFSIPSLRSAYGIPRWIGQLLAVLGSRQVDEINFAYFENKSVPPLAMLVSGGRVTDSTIDRIKDFIENEIKGKHNFHKLLVLEAEDGGNALGDTTGRARIDLKPLTQAMHNDALFQKYDERNLDKVGMAFRLPRLLRGDIRDFNRATAEAAIEFAEKQVFQPEREGFDFVMNRKILPLLGIRFWQFRSNSPKLTDPMEQGKLIALLAEKGVLIPAEARQEAAKVLNRDLRDIEAPWTRQPIMLTQAGVTPPPAAGDEVEGEAQEAAATVADRPLVELTGTDLASIVTVNEVRSQSGLVDLKLPGGARDPDGDLTVAEFKAKRTVVGEVEGEAQAQTAEGQTKSAGTLVPAQGNKLQQVLPGFEAEMGKAALLQNARYLIDLRNAMAQAEYEAAQREFEAAAEDEASDDLFDDEANIPGPGSRASEDEGLPQD